MWRARHLAAAIRSATGGLPAVSGVISHETQPAPGRRVPEEFRFPVHGRCSCCESPGDRPRTASGAAQRRLATLRLAIHTLDQARGATPHGCPSGLLTAVRNHEAERIR
jgi:hypothetical protein